MIDPAVVLLRTSELLDALVGKVIDVKVAARVECDAGGAGELPIPEAGRAKLAQEHPAIRELLDTIVEVIGNINVAGAINRHASREVELAGPGPSPSPLGNKGAGICESFNTILDSVDHSSV